MVGEKLQCTCALLFIKWLEGNISRSEMIGSLSFVLQIWVKNIVVSD